MKYTLKQMWNQFQERVLPSNCSEIQLRETKRAFYAGAECLLSTIMSNLTSDAEPTEEDFKMMNDLHQEFLDFVKLIQEGKA